jgi:hypothetical protein
LIPIFVTVDVVVVVFFLLFFVVVVVLLFYDQNFSEFLIITWIMVARLLFQVELKMLKFKPNFRFKQRNEWEKTRKLESNDSD